MDIEKIGSVSAGAEPVKTVQSKPVETAQAETAKAAVKAAVKPATKAEVSGENTDGRQNKEHRPSEATIDDAVSKANRRMEHTRCEYSYHKETNRVSIKVIDDATDEVIREIPPEKSLDMLQKMWEMAGILVDEKR